MVRTAAVHTGLCGFKSQVFLSTAFLMHISESDKH